MWWELYSSVNIWNVYLGYEIWFKVLGGFFLFSFFFHDMIFLLALVLGTDPRLLILQYRLFLFNYVLKDTSLWYKQYMFLVSIFWGLYSCHLVLSPHLMCVYPLCLTYYFFFFSPMVACISLGIYTCDSLLFLIKIEVLYYSYSSSMWRPLMLFFEAVKLLYWTIAN